MSAADGLASLRFFLRHREDVDALAAHGDAPEGARPADWSKFTRVLELAHQQAGELLHGLVQHGCDSLKPTRIRVQSVSRPVTAGNRWECVARLRLPKARADFALLGVNLGLRSELGSGLHVFFGHARQRFIRGAALHELLRRKGAHVAIADGRSDARDWVRGTLILGVLPFADTTSREDCLGFVHRTVEEKLLPNWASVTSTDDENAGE